MDVFNIAKSIEKFIFELLMWLIFYPYTLFRVIFQPNSMMEYARHETARDEAVSFESGMKPAIFLFLSIVIAAYIAPVHKEELAAMNSTQAGQYISASWVNLLFFRMLIYSIFPIVAALIYDLATPGQVTRKSLQIPFNQQCYICAPFTLATSSTFVLFQHTENPVYFGIFILAQLWLLGSNFFFFRRQLGRSMVTSAAISLAVFVIAWAGFLSVTLLAVEYKGLS
ncbi:hypothetical protein [Rhizobium herbae]|jgi:hypothetical protein